jgi:MFS transporter, DHA1 family, multidrug resistance protein
MDAPQIPLSDPDAPPRPPRPTSARAPRHMGPREFVMLMAFIQALQALSVDSMLPALGRIAQDLHLANANHRQLVVGIFLLFGGLGCLVPGTLADRYGRRPVLMVCLTLYVLFTTVCALSTSFSMLLVARALLGLACAGFNVLPAAIIRDSFEGDRMARTQSLVSMVFMVVPMIAPSVGQAVLLGASWRWIFGVMGLMGVVVMGWAFARLPETLHPDYRQSIDLPRLTRNFGEVMTCRPAVGYIISLALVTGAMLGYINSAQQLVAEHFGAGARFPLIFAAMAMTMAGTAFINSRIVVRLGARRVSHGAVLAYIVASCAQWAISGPGETLWQFLPIMTLNMCLSGFLGANFASIALQPFARVAGAAASMQAFVRVVGGAALGILIGDCFDNTARPLATAQVLCGVLTLLALLYSEKGRLFRRLNPPGLPRQVI